MKLILALALITAPIATPVAAMASDYGAFLAAQVAANQGDLPRAADGMLRALAADPSNLQMQQDAFAISLLAGRPEAVKLGASLHSNPIAALLAADTVARSGDWRGAELAYAELPKTTVTDALRPLLMAWAQQAQGQTDKALETLQTAAADSRMGLYYTLHAALIADIGHRDGMAERLYAEAGGRVAAQNLRMTQLVASWQARNGHPEKARAAIQALIHADPELGISSAGLLAHVDAPAIANARQGIAEAYTGVSGSLREAQDGAAPEMLLQLATLMQPNMTEAQLVRAEMAGREKHFRLAADTLAAIPLDDPLAAIVQLRLAEYRARAGQPAIAEALLRNLAAAHPDHGEPLIQLGDLLADQQKYPDAVAAYGRAIALLTTPQRSDWFLFYARGSARERNHDWPGAEQDMQTALKLYPDEPVVLNFLGFSWTEQRRNLPEARRMIERALDQRPDDAAMVDSLGWVMLRQGEVTQAVHTLEHAAEMMPDDATVTGHLGDAYWEAGRKTEAEDQWRRALVLKPDPDEAARIKARLDSAALPR